MNEIKELAQQLVGAVLGVGEKRANEAHVNPDPKLLEVAKEYPTVFGKDIAKLAYTAVTFAEQKEEVSKTASEEAKAQLRLSEDMLLHTAAVFASTLTKLAEEDQNAALAVAQSAVENLAELLRQTNEEVDLEEELAQIKEDVAHAIIEGRHFAFGIANAIESELDNPEFAIPVYQALIANLKMAANSAALEHALMTAAAMIGAISEYQERLEALGGEPLPIEGEDLYEELVNEIEGLFDVSALGDISSGAEKFIGELQ